METQPNDPQMPGSAPLNHTQHRTLMGVLSYLGILVIIPALMSKDDPFVKFHIKQGLVLLIIEIVVWVVFSMFLWQLWMFAQLINVGTLVLAIMGIINVVHGKEQELPVVGSFAKHLPL